MLESPIIGFLAVMTAVLFSAVAGFVPPNAGNFVAGVFLATFASYLAGEETPDAYEFELEDADI